MLRYFILHFTILTTSDKEYRGSRGAVERPIVNVVVVDSILLGGIYYFHFPLVLRQTVALSVATQHSTSRKLDGGW